MNASRENGRIESVSFVPFQSSYEKRPIEIKGRGGEPRVGETFKWIDRGIEWRGTIENVGLSIGEGWTAWGTAHRV